MAPGLGNKRMQHHRALRVAQKLKREALAKEKEEEYPPKELDARVDVVEEEPEKENDSDLDSDSEDSDEEDCSSLIVRSRSRYKSIYLLSAP